MFNMDDDLYECYFEKGYPKKIFYKHYTPLTVFKDKSNRIVGITPRKLEFWKYVYDSYEEENLLGKSIIKIKRSPTLTDISNNI